MQTVEFALSKNEVALYISGLKAEGYDPDLYRTKQRVTAPPEHFAEVADAFSKIEKAMNEEIHLSHDGPSHSAVYDEYFERYSKIRDDVGAAPDNVIQKFADAINDAGLCCRARYAMNDMGLHRKSPVYCLKHEGTVLVCDNEPEFVRRFEIAMYRYLLDCYYYSNGELGNELDKLEGEVSDGSDRQLFGTTKSI